MNNIFVTPKVEEGNSQDLSAEKWKGRGFTPGGKYLALDLQMSTRLAREVIYVVNDRDEISGFPIEQFFYAGEYVPRMKMERVPTPAEELFKEAAGEAIGEAMEHATETLTEAMITGTSVEEVRPDSAQEDDEVADDIFETMQEDDETDEDEENPLPETED